MKKLSIKRLRRTPEEAPSRITNETVAEHRERILAGGRKFKYPIQYARHKLVINALLISFASIVVLVVVGWWQLYPMQNSSTLIYRLTRILPIPVASVNGELVPYRDYLLQYRGSQYYLSKYGEIKLDSSDGRRQLDYIKRQSLDKAEQVAYARQLAPKYDISVTDSDVNSFIDAERNTSNGRVSQETYDASIQMLYNEDASDYRLSVSNGILKNKVAFAVDTSATQQVAQAGPLVKSTGGDFVKVAEAMATSKGGKVNAGQSGLVDKTSKFGGLRIADLASMKIGDISIALKSTTDDGYYFVKIVDLTDTQVNFTYLHIPLTIFANDFSTLQSQGKIHEYITVPKQ